MVHRKRILLLDLPFYRFLGFTNRYVPLGLCALGAWLETLGHTVAIHDHDANLALGRLDHARQIHADRDLLEALQDRAHPAWQEVVAKARAFAPDLIGISLLTPKIGVAITVCKLLKGAFPTVPIVLGGAHPTVQPDECLSWDIADLIVRGEGEETLAELIEALARGLPLAGVLGLSFRDSDGHVHHNPDRPLIENLDRLPAPGRHLLLNLDRYSPEDLGLIMTSRGCPFGCSFCSSHTLWTRRVRTRSLAHVASEIDHLRRQYRVSALTFKDDTFTLDRERVLAWCRLHQRRWPDLPWECVTRVDRLDADLLQEMRSARCTTVKTGVESGSPRMLARLGKGESLSEIRRGAHLLRNSGLFWSAYFMMGLPGETEEEVEATRAEMERLAPDFASIGAYEPFPGTPLFDAGVERQVFLPAMTAEQALSTPPGKYYLNNPAIRSDTLSPEGFSTLEHRIVAAFSRHNRRGRALIRRLRARLGQYRLCPSLFWRDVRQFARWY